MSGAALNPAHRLAELHDVSTIDAPANSVTCLNDEAVRPPSVAVLGWIWVAVGLGTALAALLGAAAHATAAWAAPDPSDLERLVGRFPGLALLAWMFRHFHWLAAAQIAAASAVVAIAVGFLRVRWWARQALAWVHYVTIAWLTAFALWWGAAFWSAVREVGGPSAFALLGCVALIPPFAVCAWLLLAGLRRLDAAPVRDSFAAAAGRS